MKQFCLLHVKVTLITPPSKKKKKLSLSRQIEHYFYIVYNRSLVFMEALIGLGMGLSE